MGALFLYERVVLFNGSEIFFTGAVNLVIRQLRPVDYILIETGENKGGGKHG